MPKWWLLSNAKCPQEYPESQSKKDKCHIYWAQKCPDQDKPPKTARDKGRQSRHWAARCPSIQRDRGPEVALHMTEAWRGPVQSALRQQTDIAGPEQRVQMDVVGESSVFLLCATATHSILTSFSESFSKQTCTSMGASDKPFSRPASYPSLLCLRGICILPQFLAYAHSWRVLLQKWNAILSLSLGESHGPHPGGNLWETWGDLLTNEDMKNLSGQTAYNKSTQGSGTKRSQEKPKMQCQSQ